jgi:hypothetical protein
MRPNPHPAFLVLPDGKIVGKPIPVSGQEMPSLVVKTPEELAAQRAKKAAADARKAAQAKAAQAKAAAEARAAAEAKKAATRRAAAKPTAVVEQRKKPKAGTQVRN